MVRLFTSLRGKITAAFILMVFGGTVTSVLIGNQIITSAVIKQAHSRVEHGLSVARLLFEDRINCLRDDIIHMAESQPFLESIEPLAGDTDELPRRLKRMRKEYDLDFLTFVDFEARKAIRGDEVDLSRIKDLPYLVRTAAEGQTVASAEIVGRAFIEDELDSPPPGQEYLVILAATPVFFKGVKVGVLYGGILLNRNLKFVNRLKEIIYGKEQYDGRDLGVVSVYLKDTVVASNLHESDYATRLPEAISKQVLQKSSLWFGRLKFGEDSYICAYAPIKNLRGNTIGVLHVGMLEEPFLAVRTNMMMSFLVVAIVGVIVIIGLTYILTRNMIRPLEEMVEATKRIADGDLDQVITVQSNDEIGVLAASFNRMLVSLQSMRRKLQEWAETLEKKVEQRTKEIAAMQAQIAQSEKLASLGRLAAGVAHEINNPLGGILALSMLALEDLPEDHPIRDSLDTIVQQTLRCREIVKGLLDFARQSETSPTLTEVNPIIESAIGLLDKQAMFHNIKVVKKLAKDLPPVMINTHQLQQVVMNIVLNAVDAMEESGTLTIETSHEGDDVVIRISDTGKGIPEEILPMIFEPFFTTKEPGKGTGLGLAVVHGIVTRAGGTIDVKSKVGQGTTFTIRLPAAQRETVEAASSARTDQTEQPNQSPPSQPQPTNKADSQPVSAPQGSTEQQQEDSEPEPELIGATGEVTRYGRFTRVIKQDEEPSSNPPHESEPSEQ